MMKPSLAIALYSSFALLASCDWLKQEKTEQEGTIIARVGEAQLRQEEVAGLGKGLEKADSIALVKGYVTGWVQKKLFLQKAEENLDEQIKDIDKRIQDYRESLITYSYENELIKQKLDTSVSKDEMLDYYNKNSREFELKGETYRMKYIQLKKGDPRIKEMAKLLRSNEFEDATLLNALCKERAANFSISDSSYFKVDFILQNFPLSNYDLRLMAGGIRFKEVSDDDFTYLLDISETLITGSTAPFELVKDDIRRILQNKKKLDFIDKIYKQIYEEGEQQKKFEILI